MTESKQFQWSQNEDNSYTVYMNADKVGTLNYSKDQEAWVFWPTDIDDGVTYYADLEETKSEIEFELSNSDDNE